MLNKLACESFKAINTSCRSYYEDSNLQSFPDFVRSGTPEFILKKSGDCRYFSMNDLTSDPMSGPELCEFYLSEVGRNSSDIKLMECSTNDIIYDTINDIKHNICDITYDIISYLFLALYDIVKNL